VRFPFEAAADRRVGAALIGLDQRVRVGVAAEVELRLRLVHRALLRHPVGARADLVRLAPLLLGVVAGVLADVVAAVAHTSLLQYFVFLLASAAASTIGTSLLVLASPSRMTLSSLGSSAQSSGYFSRISSMSFSTHRDDLIKHLAAAERIHRLRRLVEAAEVAHRVSADRVVPEREDRARRLVAHRARAVIGVVAARLPEVVVREHDVVVEAPPHQGVACQVDELVLKLLDVRPDQAEVAVER
jgi:hypothetical protein